MYLVVKTEQLCIDDAGVEYRPAPYTPGSPRCRGCTFRAVRYRGICEALLNFCDDREDGMDVIWKKQKPRKPLPDPNPL